MRTPAHTYTCIPVRHARLTHSRTHGESALKRDDSKTHVCVRARVPPRSRCNISNAYIYLWLRLSDTRCGIETDNPVGGPPNPDFDSPREFKWSPIRLPPGYRYLIVRERVLVGQLLRNRWASFDAIMLRCYCENDICKTIAFRYMKLKHFTSTVLIFYPTKDSRKPNVLF